MDINTPTNNPPTINPTQKSKKSLVIGIVAVIVIIIVILLILVLEMENI